MGVKISAFHSQFIEISGDSPFFYEIGTKFCLTGVLNNPII
jgi:hypothetical protein